MNDTFNVQGRLVAAFCAAVSVPFALAALYSFGAASNGDIPSIFDGASALSISVDAAKTLYNAFWLDTLGFYILTIPIVLFLWSALREANQYIADLSAIFGFVYALMGCFGAATMAASHEALHAAYLAASETQQAGLEAAWVVTVSGQWSGLWLAETVAGACSYLGFAYLLAQSRHAKLAISAVIIAVTWFAQFAAWILGFHEVSAAAGNVVILMTPLWTACLAFRLFRTAV